MRVIVVTPDTRTKRGPINLIQVKKGADPIREPSGPSLPRRLNACLLRISA